MAMKFREPNRARWVGTRPAHDGEQVIAYKLAVDATQIIYTVPAGKVLHLTNAMIFASSLAVGHGYIFIRNVADVPVLYLVQFRYISGAGMGTGHANQYWPPIEVLEGYDIAITSGAAGLTLFGNIHGWVENA
jgi:hypothetical protein